MNACQSIYNDGDTIADHECQWDDGHDDLHECHCGVTW